MLNDEWESRALGEPAPECAGVGRFHGSGASNWFQSESAGD
jgi:hypothetical protein